MKLGTLDSSLSMEKRPETEMTMRDMMDVPHKLTKKMIILPRKVNG